MGSEMCIRDRDRDDRTLADFLLDTPGYRDINTATYALRTASMICLSQDQFMTRHSLSTLEALLLLIYMISNNDGAERAWTLLGEFGHLTSDLRRMGINGILIS